MWSKVRSFSKTFLYNNSPPPFGLNVYYYWITCEILARIKQEYTALAEISRNTLFCYCDYPLGKIESTRIWGDKIHVQCRAKWCVHPPQNSDSMFTNFDIYPGYAMLSLNSDLEELEMVKYMNNWSSDFCLFQNKLAFV